MSAPSVPLTALSDAQRAQGQTRFTIIRPALEDGVTQAQVARTHTIPASTVQRWVKRYREKGLAGLAQEPTALTTALALRTAIWRKEDPRWQVCGIPSVFYTDHGSDFTSKHMEQVATDLGIELIFSEKGVPRGRGKIERLMMQVEHILEANDLQVVTKEVVETARENLVIGLN